MRVATKAAPSRARAATMVEEMSDNNDDEISFHSFSFHFHFHFHFRENEIFHFHFSENEIFHFQNFIVTHFHSFSLK